MKSDNKKYSRPITFQVPFSPKRHLKLATAVNILTPIETIIGIIVGILAIIGSLIAFWKKYGKAIVTYIKNIYPHSGDGNVSPSPALPSGSDGAKLSPHVERLLSVLKLAKEKDELKVHTFANEIVMGSTKGTHSKITNSSFTNVIFQNCRMHAIDFIFTDLRNVRFESARLERIEFKNSDLTGAVFNGGKIIKCSFSGSTLDKAKFEMISIEHDGSNQREAASCKDMIFRKCDFYHMTVREAQAIFPEAKFKNCNFNSVVQ